jgi:GNAT superfamily N-acetyltransferase
MSNATPSIPRGYSIVPPRHVANVATFLEMRTKPQASSLARDHDLTLERWRDADLITYRSLFKAIGENWMWYSRLVMPDHELKRIFREPRIEIYRLLDKGTVAGLLELDFSEKDECELSFFGLLPEAIGKGAGRFLMNEAIRLAGPGRSSVFGCIRALSITRQRFPSTAARASRPIRSQSRSIPTRA